MKPTQRLQTRLSILLGGVLLAILILIGVSIYVFVSSAESVIWQERQSEAGRNAAAQTQNYIEVARATLQTIAQIDETADELPRIFAAIIDQNPAYLEFVVVSDRGRVQHSASAGEPILANLFTLSQSNWFQSALNASAGELFLGDVQVSPQNVPYIIISTRTYSGGVAALRLSLSVLGDVVAGLRFGTTGTTYVVQEIGFVAAHPDPAIVQNLVVIPDSAALQGALAAPDSPWTGSYINFEGEAVIGTSSVIPDTNLVVITEISQSEATTNARNALIILVSITVLFWVAAILATNASIRSLVFVPLNRLQKGANEVEQGNLEYQVAVARPDEIGQLTHSFNAMARRLNARAIEREGLINDLQTAKLLAEENSRLKSEFLSTMSHELRTPMNAIEGFTSIMLNHMGGVEYNDKTEHYISRVNVNSQRLLQLINDFLDLSRIEAGRLELVSEPFSPAELAKRLQSEIGVLADAKNIGFEINIDPAMPQTIYGDEEAISKVAINLLGNAIKFTEKGKVTLSIAYANNKWRIIVSDTGIGIPPHARNFIFEEFRQVDQTSKRRFGGTGLGLAIVQKYTRNMGGTVSLQSELGKGSTFTVELPLITQPEAAEVTHP